MNLDVNKDIEKTSKSAEIIVEKITKEYNKPPLGATPYWFAIENRIEELASAILRYNRFNGNVKSIKEWAKEIILYCELTEQMKDMTL